MQKHLIGLAHIFKIINIIHKKERITNCIYTTAYTGSIKRRRRSCGSSANADEERIPCHYRVKS